MALAVAPSFVGGEEVGPYSIRLLAAGDVVLDLTGFTYRVEVWWDGCAQITLYEDAGITRLGDVPTSDGFHFSWGLSETQGKCVPLGVTQVKMFFISAADVTYGDLMGIKRTL